MTLTCDELCQRLDLAAPEIRWADITGVATLADATGDDLCFVESADQHEAVLASAAAVVLAPLDYPEPAPSHLIRVAEPRRVFFALAENRRIMKFAIFLFKTAAYMPEWMWGRVTLARFAFTILFLSAIASKKAIKA